MATIPLGKTAIFTISRAFPKPSYAFFNGGGKVSNRVSFTSATTKHAEGHYGDDHDRRRDHRSGDKYGEEAADRTSEMAEDAKQRMKSGVDTAKERTQEMTEKARETAERAKDRTSSMAEKAAEKTQEAKERTAEAAYETKEKAKEKAHEAREKTMGAAETAADKTKQYAHETKEKTKGAAETVAEKTKEGMQKVAEMTTGTAQTIGQKAKQTMHKIKETVVGTSSDEESVDDFIEDHVKKPAKEHKVKTVRSPAGGREGVTMDEDVVETRRKALERNDGDMK